MGVFTILTDCEADSTLISNLFIDEYMKDADATALKVYLYLVRMMRAGRPASIADMAELFHTDRREILRALRFWEEENLLSLQLDRTGRLASIHMMEVRPKSEQTTAGNVVTITPNLAEECGAEAESSTAQADASDNASSAVSDTETDHTPDRAESALMQGHHAATGMETASAARKGRAVVRGSAGAGVNAQDIKCFMDDEDKAQLLFIVEQYIGKPLSASEIQTVYYISEELHFSGDLIDYLVQYCVERGKKDFRYIEKVAISWAENGITTSAQAREKSMEISKQKRSRGMTRPQNNRFNQFQQNSYDYDALEKKILGDN